MIHIEKNQEIPENKNLRVFSQTGDYEDTALIECYDIANPLLPSSSLQAQFIKYGGLVYQFNEPEELGEAIAKRDSKSTHDAVLLWKEDRARLQKRMKGTLEPENPVPVTENQNNIQTEPVVTPNDTVTPPVDTIIDSAPNTTTTPVAPDITPITQPIDVVENIATTTPDMLDTNITSTTTPIVDIGDATTSAETL